MLNQQKLKMEPLVYIYWHSSCDFYFVEKEHSCSDAVFLKENQVCKTMPVIQVPHQKTRPMENPAIQEKSHKTVKDTKIIMTAASTVTTMTTMTTMITMITAITTTIMP